MEERRVHHLRYEHTKISYHSIRDFCVCVEGLGDSTLVPFFLFNTFLEVLTVCLLFVLPMVFSHRVVRGNSRYFVFFNLL